ncbi:MAG: glycosyltransferase family 4 protein [Deltaproteobacteria bacterium]|nr:glycosyltransferase family 4 protein [Deltaproteobacteria bacterium]
MKRTDFTTGYYSSNFKGKSFYFFPYGWRTLRRVENKINTLSDIKDKIRLIPFVKDIEEIYHLSDIIVVPSTEPESFGLTAVEAMAAKKPVVASAHGGLLDIVIDGETGILVPPNDQIALANAIVKLIEDPLLRKSMGEAGRKRQRELFSIERYVKEFEEVYSILEVSQD